MSERIKTGLQIYNEIDKESGNQRVRLEDIKWIPAEYIEEFAKNEPHFPIGQFVSLLIRNHSEQG